MNLTSEVNQFQDEVREGYVPEKKTAPDYGEPWKNQIGSVRDRMEFLISLKSPAIADRVAACVNACAGMTNPEAEITALRSRLEEAYAALSTCQNYCYSDGTVHHQRFDNDKVGMSILRIRPFIKP